MMASPSLSLIVLTYNEELHLRRCLESVDGLARQVFVVDSGSSDRTLDIARELADHTQVHEFVDQARQFNWALANLPIETEWILRLDADEYLLPDLKAEIASALAAAQARVGGFLMKRRIIFQDRWIRFGGIYPRWFLRLFRRGQARCERRVMDEHIVLVEGKASRLKHDFVDHNLRDLRAWMEKHLDYAEREAMVLAGRDDRETPQAEEGLETGARRRRWFKRNVYRNAPPLLRALLYFLYRYVLKLGFMDGRPGLVYHVLQGFWYRFYVDALLLQSRWRDVD